MLSLFYFKYYILCKLAENCFQLTHHSFKRPKTRLKLVKMRENTPCRLSGRCNYEHVLSCYYIILYYMILYYIIYFTNLC